MLKVGPYTLELREHDRVGDLAWFFVAGTSNPPPEWLAASTPEGHDWLHDEETDKIIGLLLSGAGRAKENGTAPEVTLPNGTSVEVQGV